MSIGARLTARSTRPGDRRALAEIALAILVLLAIVLRLEPILVEPSAVWPDEIFQTTEPAHRLVFGSGLVPWEFQLGARSWLLPGVIAGVMELSRLAGDGPAYYLPLIAVAFAALAAAPVICSFLWCRPRFGASGALLAATVVAVAPELVYFGARTLSETVAGHLLVVALYVLEPGHRVTSHRRLVLGGSLVGLVLVTRAQLVPAVLVAAQWTNWQADRERLVAMLVGAGTILLAAGFLDALTLGYPLASIWRYILYNVYYGVSSTFGVEPWTYYLLGEFGVWGGASATLLLLAFLGAWRMPLLLVLALVILAVHSGIAHKEYRFIYPAILLVSVLAGIGLAQMASWGRDWLIERGMSENLAALASAALALAWWGGASFQVWNGTTLTALRRNMHDNLVAASFVAHRPAPCGIGLYGLAGIDWKDYGGYTYFHRPAPMYWPEDEAGLIATGAGFDTLLYTRPPPPSLGFTTLRCIGEVCVAHRPGGCWSIPVSPLPMPTALLETLAAKTTPPAGSERGNIARAARTGSSR
jgi:phosphatidylinositol glycan class B